MTKTELAPAKWNSQTESLELIDQRLLPYELKYLSYDNHIDTAAAIKDMVLRGAPLIGITAAYGMALAAKNGADLKEADALLRSTRPTAVNLMWALDECNKLIEAHSSEGLYEALLEKAHWILADDIKRCKKMGEVGADYIVEKYGKKKFKIMTHCNAGALATGGYGTALGVIRALHKRGLVEMVYSDETRPRQQGSRLTAWELAYDNIPVTMNTDNMSAHLMKLGKIDLVITGSDRITANGDAANKIGTYGLAISANFHKIPFFIAAPHSTIDMSLEHGDLIPIEERSYTEVSHINGESCTLSADVLEKYSDAKDFGEVKYANPGFDVTPRVLIEAIFTEQGLF